MLNDFVTIVLKNGKTTRYNLKQGLTLLPEGLCNQVTQAYSSRGELIYDEKEQH